MFSQRREKLLKLVRVKRHVRLFITKIERRNRTWYADDSGLISTLLLNLAQVNITEDKRKIDHFVRLVAQISNDISLATLH